MHRVILREKKLAEKLLVVIGIFWICLIQNSFAEEIGIGFDVSPVFPNSQIDRERGYYYLQTEPGREQTFSLLVSSTSDKEKKLEIWVENAISSSTGVIAYSKDLSLVHDSLVNPITEIVQVKEKEVILKPGEEQVIHLKLTPPNEHYEGVKIGRVVIREKTEEKKIGIKQEYEYGIGIITSELGVTYKDGKVISLDRVQPNINLGNKVIEAHMFNPEPKTIENLTVKSYVTKKDDEKKIKERNIDGFTFAPNSKLIYQLPWGLTDFKQGEYTFHFEAENEFDEFNLKEDFIIRGNKAKEMNHASAFSVQTPKKIKWIITGSLISLLCIIILILKREGKWTREVKNKQKKSNAR